MTILKTLKIISDTELGYQIINESDYDSSTHKLFDSDDSDEDDAPKVRKTRAKTERSLLESNQ